jgi:hypothetical protein
MYALETYFSYIAISLIATLWVGRTLHRSGRIFLADAFHGNAELADSVNHLLAVGFYLVNFGYTALALRSSGGLDTVRDAVETVSVKIGLVLVILGVVHFGNLYVLNQMRQRAGLHPPPPRPSAWTPADAPIGRILE